MPFAVSCDHSAALQFWLLKGAPAGRPGLPKPAVGAQFRGGKLPRPAGCRKWVFSGLFTKGLRRIRHLMFINSFAAPGVPGLFSATRIVARHAEGWT